MLLPCRMNFWPFQSTLPQRERRMIVPDQWTSLRHFNPRSRKGSDPRNGILHPASSDISIHAPAKGATINFLCCCNSAGISIHAPAKGATRSSCFGLRYISNFNPRSRKGSDRITFQTSTRYPAFQSTLPQRERPNHLEHWH